MTTTVGAVLLTVNDSATLVAKDGTNLYIYIYIYIYVCVYTFLLSLLREYCATRHFTLNVFF